MERRAHLMKRYRAERRFVLYGKVAIAIALVGLLFLLGTVVGRGINGFFCTQLHISVKFDRQVLGESESQWKHADASLLLKEALLQQFPGVSGHKPLRELMGMFSSAASMEIRQAVLRDSSLLGKQADIWLTASDAVDRFIKDGKGARFQRITESQKGWLAMFREKSAMRTVWNPFFLTSGDSREPEMAGFMGSLVGTLFTLLVCLLAALPVGVLAAIYLEEFSTRNRITEWIEISINNLAAVPSIVFGLLGLAVYLNMFGMPRSAPLAGGLTLALMILPTIIITSRASLRAVPDTIRDAARGLGASPLQVVMHHTFPLALPGVMTGVILGVARAMGETAPLLMIGMVAFIVDIPHGITDAATSMPVQIYLWATSPEPSFVEKTAAGIIVLLFVLITLNSLAIYVRKRSEHKW